MSAITELSINVLFIIPSLTSIKSQFYISSLFQKTKLFPYIILFFLHIEGKFFISFWRREQSISSLLRKNLKINDRSGISSDYLKYLPRSHISQIFFGTQNWKWAIKASYIKFFIKIHAFFSQKEITNNWEIIKLSPVKNLVDLGKL